MIPRAVVEGGGEDEQACRSRHPSSAAWRPDLGRMTRRMAAMLRDEGHPWPDAAAALLAERGRLGLDREAFAARIGVPVTLVVVIEDGRPSTVSAPAPRESASPLDGMS